MLILWSAAQQPCEVFGSHYSPGATWAGQGCSSAWRERGHRGNQGTPRLRMRLRWIPVGHQDAVSLPPCKAHGQVGHSGLSHAHQLYSTGMAQLGPGSKHQDHTKGCIVRMSSSMLTQHVHKSSRHRMPLRSVFRARHLAGLNQHNCSGICRVMQIYSGWRHSPIISK